jgi:hypothetical protein
MQGKSRFDAHKIDILYKICLSLVGIFVLRFIISFKYNCSQSLLNYLAFQSLDYGRIWWMLSQNPCVRPQLDDLLLYYTHTIKPVDDVLYIFNWNWNLYAHTFQGQLGINYFPVYMIYYFNVLTWRVEHFGCYIYLLSFLKFQDNRLIFHRVIP